MSQAVLVSLCVEVARAQASSERGHSAQWTVSAWASGGNVPDATIRLKATPASGGTPGFSFGCGKDDGTASCDLGAVDANSAQRQLQAQLTVPVTASAVTSVSLTATGSTAHLAKAPTASATVSITAPQNPATVPPVPAPITAPLPVGNLPSIPAVNPTLSPGGNAGDLFPTLDPRETPTSTKSPTQTIKKAHTRPIANTSALPEGAPVIGAQLAGLAALTVAFVLAVTRLSIRRRPTKPTQDATSSAAPTTEQSDETPQEAAPEAPTRDGE